MKHLHLEWNPESPDATRRLRLMQDSREIPAASDAGLASFLSQGPLPGRLAEGAKRQMLEIMLPWLPKDAIVAVDGIVKFCARGLDDARRCAYEALSADSGSRIACQLLSLLW